MVVILTGISPTAIILIAIAALLIFGPKKLPELGRAVGVTLREFKKGTKGLIEDEENDTKKVVIDQKASQIEQNNVQSNNNDQENAK